MRAGNVAASWRENRRRFALGLPDVLPFVDVEHQDTWNMIEAAVAMPAGVDHLDVGHVRGPDRVLEVAPAGELSLRDKELQRVATSYGLTLQSGHTFPAQDRERAYEFLGRALGQDRRPHHPT